MKHNQKAELNDLILNLDHFTKNLIYVPFKKRVLLSLFYVDISYQNGHACKEDVWNVSPDLVSQQTKCRNHLKYKDKFNKPLEIG